MKIYIISLVLLLAACSPATDAESNEPATTSTLDNDQVAKEDTVSVLEGESESLAEAEVTEASEEYTSTEYEDLDWLEYEASLTKDFSFVIIISTKSYDAALERAKDASIKLGYPLDLRGLHPNDEMGLSLPKEVCEAICGGDIVDYPQYLPRNDWGESKYVSVEYSNGFKGFTKGYYIVVVASGEKGDPIIKEAVEESRKFYKDAYAKTCGVWMGCGC